MMTGNSSRPDNAMRGTGGWSRRRSTKSRGIWVAACSDHNRACPQHDVCHGRRDSRRGHDRPPIVTGTATMSAVMLRAQHPARLNAEARGSELRKRATYTVQHFATVK